MFSMAFDMRAAFNLEIKQILITMPYRNMLKGQDPGLDPEEIFQLFFIGGSIYIKMHVWSIAHLRGFSSVPIPS